MQHRSERAVGWVMKPPSIGDLLICRLTSTLYLENRSTIGHTIADALCEKDHNPDIYIRNRQTYHAVWTGSTSVMRSYVLR